MLKRSHSALRCDFNLSPKHATKLALLSFRLGVVEFLQLHIFTFVLYLAVNAYPLDYTGRRRNNNMGVRGLVASASVLTC